MRNLIIFCISVGFIFGCNANKYRTGKTIKYLDQLDENQILEQVKTTDTFTLLVLEIVLAKECNDSLPMVGFCVGLDLKTNKIIMVNSLCYRDTNVRVGDFVKAFPVKTKINKGFRYLKEMRKVDIGRRDYSPLYSYKSMDFDGEFKKIDRMEVFNQ